MNSKSKKFPFYGNPLRVIAESKPTWRTARDDQGRQRFHGAFTGGFKAGYFNTVGSIEGFQPKSFYSSRRDSKSKTATGFIHKPEDYMDEEDFSEFGIAPKRLKVSRNQYRADSKRIRLTGKSPEIHESTIGLKLLSQVGAGKPEFNVDSDSIRFYNSLIVGDNQNNYGLGYKPLMPRTSSTVFVPPVEAITQKGKKIQIQGSAFGYGVLDDQIDDCIYDHDDSWMYDSLGNYKRLSARIEKPPVPSKRYEFSDSKSHRTIDGFTEEYVESCPGSSEDKQYYKSQISSINIPKDWIAPERINMKLNTSCSNINDELSKSYDSHKSAAESVMAVKFVASSSTPRYIDQSNKQGLIHYAELKAEELKKKSQPRLTDNSQDSHLKRPVTIDRSILDWIPCSLLCKRFNLANPYPHASKFGTKLDGKVTNKARPEETVIRNCDENIDKLLKSIYNV